jgi:Fe-S cluster assembly protein SufD
VNEHYRPQPFFIYYFYDSEQGQVFGNPNIQITAHSNTRIQILEKTISTGTHPVFINKKVGVHVKANAQVNITKIQNYKKHIFQVYNLEVNQDAQSTFNSNVYSFAGGLIRNNLSINQLGEHCESHMHGLYLITGHSHVDNHTSVNHTQPNSYSNELYKGILDENARAVFNGKIFVRPEAQKTNAFQSNQNINLSDSASIHTKPQLEIWADDVKCSHGCTVGQMDEEALFYLRARGIGKNQAKALILIAFSEQSLEYIPFEFVKEEIDTLIRKRLIG